MPSLTNQHSISNNMTTQSNLPGKTALVTGGSRGIGRATALALGQAGAQVIVHYVSAEKEATAAAGKQLAGHGCCQKSNYVAQI